MVWEWLVIAVVATASDPVSGKTVFGTGLAIDSLLCTPEALKVFLKSGLPDGLFSNRKSQFG
jgi:hypothetical protein